MTRENESTSLLNNYLGLDGRTLITFGTLVGGVFVVVTGIYVAIFGFESWTRDMQQAGNMMVAGFNTAAGGVAPVQVFQPPQPSGQRPETGRAGAAPAAQFVCPNCGAVGLPRWSNTGTPVCPNCGGVMAVAGRAGNPVQLAARP